MALKKDIELDNGIVLSYHRIAKIENVVNDCTKLIIISYINQKQREKESDRFTFDNVYKLTTEEKLNYNDTLTIQEAYEYLKTIPKYEGAEDVFEDNDKENNKPWI